MITEVGFWCGEYSQRREFEIANPRSLSTADVVPIERALRQWAHDLPGRPDGRIRAEWTIALPTFMLRQTIILDAAGHWCWMGCIHEWDLSAAGIERCRHCGTEQLTDEWLDAESRRLASASA